MSDTNPDPSLPDLLKQLFSVCSAIVKKLSGQSKGQIAQSLEGAVQQDLTGGSNAQTTNDNSTNQPSDPSNPQC